MIESGPLVSVVEVPEGSSLTVAAASAATTLVVYSTADFNEDGGLLSVAGATYTYDPIATPGTLTLTSGLAAAVDEGEAVLSLDATGAQESVRKVLVQLSEDDPEPVEAILTLEQRPFYPLGDVLAGTIVEVEASGDGYRVVSAPTTPPTMDGSVIDPATLPTPPLTDGDAPTAATTVTSIGGIGSMFYRWTEVANADPVTYRLHVRAGSAPTTDGTYEVAAGVGLTFASVRKLKDGTAIVGDGTVTYHAIVTVEDGDGPGPASATVTGTPVQATGGDIAVNALTTNHLTTNDLLADSIEASDLTGRTVTGALLRTAPSGRRVQIQPSGTGSSEAQSVEFWSGKMGEVRPAQVYALTAGDLWLIAGSDDVAEFVTEPLSIFGSTIYLGTNFGSGETLTVDSTGVSVTKMGSGSVGTGTFRDSVDTRVKGTDTWHTITPLNGYTAGSPTPEYRLDGAGRVTLRGRIDMGTAANAAILVTLPVGSRPPAALEIPTVTYPIATATGLVQINTNGDVLLRKGQGTPTTYKLDGVSFSTIS